MAKNGTIAYVTELPQCNFCQILTRRLQRVMEEVEVTRAKYDFRTQDGRWAFGCEAHYQAFRLYPDLGTGKGQRLEVRPKVQA